VYVRGVGAVTPLAAGWRASAAALADGQCAVRPVKAFDASGFPSTVAAAVVGGDAGERCEDRRRGLALRAAREAWAQAALAAPAERIGIFLGAESGRASFATVLALSRAAGGGPRFDHHAFARGAPALAPGLDASVISPSAVASRLAGELGARGPVETLSLACASGLAAIVEAARAIRLGLCDVALAGGVGADVDPLMLAGFGLLGALSARGVSRPFDVHRDGFVVGEGAAMAVLSSERGGAAVEVAGLGRSLDAFHLTAPDPDGDGAARAMRAALADAGGAAVGYVQAHGTSTPLNDAVEAAAIRRVLGAQLDSARVASVKGALGHAVAGAGALGFLCAVEAVASDTLLPTANLLAPDPACALPHVAGRAVERRVGAALVNAFAFGGANASVVVRRVERP
jgi:3-oxoacyl-[acyl-carrier-protein] synthase II